MSVPVAPTAEQLRQWFANFPPEPCGEQQRFGDGYTECYREFGHCGWHESDVLQWCPIK